MEKLDKANCSFNINWVARSDNISDFENLLDLSKKYNAKSVSVTCNKLVGSSRKVDSQLTKADLIILADIIKRRNDIIIRVESCYPQLTAKIRKLNKIDGCYAAIINCFVTIERMFAPCSYLMEYSEYYDNISEYWNNSQVLKKLRNRSKCTKCNLNCNFCLATSYNSYKNFDSSLEECYMV